MAGNEKVKRDITAKDIRCLLAIKYEDPRQYSCACEVSNRTGWSERRLDFVAVDCYESHKFEILAFEIKISKSDFRRELTDPSKHNVFFSEIDKYSIVAPDYVLDDMSIIPPKWGVYHVIRNKEGELELKTVRKPLALHDEQAKERPISRPFMASLCRAINTQSHVASRMYKDRDAIEAEIRAGLEERLTNGGRIISSYDYENYERLKRVTRQLDIPTWEDGITDAFKKRFRMALDIVTNVHRIDSQLNEIQRISKFARKYLKEIMQGNTEEVNTTLDKIKALGYTKEDGLEHDDVEDVI